jgi:hypothetical protein
LAERNKLARKPEKVANRATPTVSIRTPTIRPPVLVLAEPVTADLSDDRFDRFRGRF